MNDLKIEFFEKALERVREIRQNLEGLAEDAKKAGLDDLPFDVWRRRLDRWERHFQGRIFEGSRCQEDLKARSAPRTLSAMPYGPASSVRRQTRGATGLPNAARQQLRPEHGAHVVFAEVRHVTDAPFVVLLRRYAIHGTGAIRQLGRPASHGCVRLHPANARALYPLVGSYGGARIHVRT